MIHILTALPCEAKPLIKHYQLNGQQARHGFRIYENQDMRLIISGLGKINAAAAAAYLQALHPEQRAAWLNLGIAGHAEMAIGQMIIADKICDANNEQRYYPPGLCRSPCPRTTVFSLDRPATNYPEPVAYDMEASAFYATALRFSSSEIIQVAKIISDNRHQGIEHISAAHTEQMMTDNISNIDDLVQQLKILNEQLQAISVPARGFADFMQHWRFSVSQQHQLQRLLQQWLARSDTPVEIDNYLRLKNSKAVIQALRQDMEKLSYRFDT